MAKSEHSSPLPVAQSDSSLEHLADHDKVTGPHPTLKGTAYYLNSLSPHTHLSNDELALGSDSSRQDRGWFMTGDASLRQA